MAASASQYDSSLTPWTRVFQDCIRDPDVHEAVAMKCSQSGFTEAALNVIRWMPGHSPGNVAYVINSNTKAKRISRVRLGTSLKDCAAAQVSDDLNDFSTNHIILKNMEIAVSGSGSANPFREVWYKAAFLDEPEDHEEHGDGTTYSLINSRFTTVADHTLFVIGKPKFEGGIIHRTYAKGSQEIWVVPCPRCNDFIELTFPYMKFGHCRDLIGGWELEEVINNTFFECSSCGRRIDEHEKEGMNADGKHFVLPPERRMKLEKKSIPPEPGVRSFHVSDYHSMFPGVAWGLLAKKWLMAHVIAPNQLEQDDYRANHDGKPIKAKEFGLMDTAIDNLRGGLIEEVDGKKSVLGVEFGLVYESGEQLNPLPIRPALITITGDRQGDRIMYLVFAWNKKGEAWLIDYGSCDDESEFLTLRHRPYPYYSTAGEPPETFYIFGGLIDSRYRMKRIYELCLDAQASGWSLWPTRGSGFHSEFKGKNLREVEDYTDKGEIITLYEYYDHAIKNDFYLGKISRRENPRLWLPNPVPRSIKAEWTSEKLTTKQIGGRKIQKWEHDDKLGPNDLGDCGKKQYICWQLLAPELDL
ncbi:MAG: terminase gpA endonuclease subunit [Alphaproteobacteria bacterium]